jgi:isoleucyl-tRNA synthetase
MVATRAFSSRCGTNSICPPMPGSCANAGCGCASCAPTFRRSDVQKQLESLRVAGKIGSSLAGEVELYANGEEAQFLRSFDDDLRFVFITSQARVVHEALTEAVPTALPGVKLAVAPSSHPKCERCWHYRPDVGSDREHPDICGRCVSNLFGAGEARSHA